MADEREDGILIAPGSGDQTSVGMGEGMVSFPKSDLPAFTKMYILAVISGLVVVSVISAGIFVLISL